MRMISAKHRDQNLHICKILMNYIFLLDIIKRERERKRENILILFRERRFFLFLACSMPEPQRN